jgi:hypothetical protein
MSNEYLKECPLEMALYLDRKCCCFAALETLSFTHYLYSHSLLYLIRALALLVSFSALL